jgi:predicted metal-dependent hydrolase
MGDFLRSLSSAVTGIFSSNYPLVPVKSNVDGKTYRVRDMADKQEAADLLAKLRLKLTTLCDHLEKKYPDKAQVRQIVTNFRSDPNRFLEATPDAAHTSYSVNKGEEIHLCLRQRSAGDESLVNENVMTFVALHELAHVCTESVGHGPDFWNNFGWLLREAEAIGVYKYTDFQAQPVTYCGVSITDSPRYDPAKDGSNLQIGTMKKTA